MHSKVILIIDDDPEDQEIFIDAITEIDSAILCLGFLSGEEALEMINAEAFDVPDFIFLDLNMPRFTGRQCLIELKKIKKLIDTPIAIYSTSAEQRDRDETIKLGATFFLTKPSRFDVLREKLNEIISTAEKFNEG